MSTKHSKTAEKFQENKELAGWHDQTLWMMRAKRDKISREVPELSLIHISEPTRH